MTPRRVLPASRGGGLAAAFWAWPVAAGWLAASLAWSQPSVTVEQALDSVRSDIEQSVAELNALREQVATERRALVGPLESLQKEVADLRRQVDRIHSVDRRGEDQATASQRRVDSLAEECRLAQTLLSEYRRSLETRIGPAEAPLVRDGLRALDEALVVGDGWGGLPAAASRTLAFAESLNAERVGGVGFAGVALGADGVERAGRFALYGPSAYFAADGGEPAGLVVTRVGSDAPGVFAKLGDAERGAIRALVAGAKATVPVDVTKGDALKVAAARDTFAEHVRKGGLVMIPILAIGVLSVGLAVLKFGQLLAMRVGSRGALAPTLAALRRGDVSGAQAAARALGQPLADIVLEGIAHRDAPREHLEEILYEHSLAKLPTLERHLGTLAVFGGVAPLLGLLGTVTGMIHTFQLITIFGTGDAKLLSGGISEALITTEFGLAIAIPVLLAHAYLARRVRTMVAALERAGVEFVTGLKAGGDAA
jgi:biopolymer transport protein ExbB